MTTPPDTRGLFKSAAAYARLQAVYDANLAAWPIAYEIRWVETRLGLTQVIMAGRADGLPVVVFHGWGGNSSSALDEYDLRLLAEHFRLYFPDTPGQSGRSTPNVPEPEWPGYGMWAADVLDGLGLATAYVMGMSGGGYLTLVLAAYAPDRVRAGLAVSPAGLAKPHISLARGWAAIWALLTPNERTVGGFMRSLQSPRGPRDRQDAFGRQMTAVFATVKQMPQTPEALPDAALAKIRAPLVMMVGADDTTWHTDVLLARAQALIPQVVIERPEKAGHAIGVDVPGVMERRAIDLFEGVAKGE